MREFLVFSLVAPMGSFGDLAGHEQRGSHIWPGRSAILGLMGAALGVRREDKNGQEALNLWKMAVSVLNTGSIWRDFHTVQTVPSARIKRPATRREAVSALNNSDNGLITRRDYVSDCAFGVALWGGDVETAVQALKHPKFTLYLGRKSCPLSAPTMPKGVQADHPLDALSQICLPDFLDVNPAKPKFVTSDEDLGQGRVETRWDVPLDREEWHFGPRNVHILSPMQD